MRVLFINRFYWPETPATGQLLADLAEALAARGHAVEVITSAAAPRTERVRGVLVRRVRGTRCRRGGVVGKAIDFATFYVGAVAQVLRWTRRGTLVVAMTDPPLLGIGAWLAARLRGARVVHWAQDIYPEVAIALSGHRWLRVFRPLRNAAWRHADHCVTLGQDMAEVLARAAVPGDAISVIANSTLRGTSDASLPGANPLRQAWQLGDRFIVAYSGNLGRVHDLEPILEVAAALRTETRIVFLFIGEGAQRGALEAAASGRKLTNVLFRPTQPRDRLAESLALADLHLVTLRAGCEHFVFPSKLYGAAASGRPILFIGPRGCEVARLVRQHDLGAAAERHEVAELAAFIGRLAHDAPLRARHAAAARQFADAHTAERAADQWCTLLATVDACRVGRRPANTPAR